jgi:hypothetical protein
MCCGSETLARLQSPDKKRSYHGMVKLFGCDAVLWQEDGNGERAACEFGYWLICRNWFLLRCGTSLPLGVGQHERGDEGGRRVLPWPVRSLRAQRLRHRLLPPPSSLRLLGLSSGLLGVGASYASWTSSIPVCGRGRVLGVPGMNLSLQRWSGMR